MENIANGYYFMFEIGWFVDLLIPTLVRVVDGGIYFVGSKASECKNLKPCCMPCGGTEEIKKMSIDDPSVKAFNTLGSLIKIQDMKDIKSEFTGTLEKNEIREKYFNSTAKKQREAVSERILSDYDILSKMD